MDTSKPQKIGMVNAWEVHEKMPDSPHYPATEQFTSVVHFGIITGPGTSANFRG